MTETQENFVTWLETAADTWAGMETYVDAEEIAEAAHEFARRMWRWSITVAVEEAPGDCE